jgi:uncharacterized Ntn-hydrolase superfamily protein
VTGVLALGLLCTALAAPGAATWSLVAVDPETGEVGVAMAGCGPVATLGSPDAVLDPIALVPGRGVAVAQAAVDPDRVAQLARLLEETAVGASDGADAGARASGVPAGSAPQLLALITEQSDDALAANRQYALAALAGGAATYTGGEVGVAGPADVGVDAYSGSRSSDRAAALGVLVVDEAVVDDALAAYLAARDEGQPLARGLAQGLLAGSEAGGDPDCREQTALYAHLAVASPGDEGSNPTTLLTATVDEDDGQNPVALVVSGLDEGERGWLDAGRRPARRLSRLVVLAVGVAMALAAVVIIRYGMGYRFGRRTTRVRP